jgi:hypothetical protein
MKTSPASSAVSEPLSTGDGTSTGGSVFVQIDDLKKQHVSPQEAANFSDLALAKQHWVKIYADKGKNRLISFPFTFENLGSQTLCMVQNDMYGTWMLNASRIHCVCPNEEAPQDK